MDKFNDLVESGFFDDDGSFHYFGVEILTYNIHYQIGGFSFFEFWMKADGVLYT
jgi:hypothetical protein